MATPNVTRQRCGVFSPDSEPRGYRWRLQRGRVADPNLNDREIDGEKPHHIKAGIEPCTTERHELEARERALYQLGHRATDDRIEFWSISPSQKEI